MYTIYCLTNILNNKRYIGLTKLTPEQRFKKHILASQNGCQFHFARALRKYGEDKFKLESLDVCDGLNQAKVLERSWIKFHKSNDSKLGYNLTPGGDGGGKKLSEAAKQKMRLAKLGKKHSLETRIKMSETHKQMSIETKQKIGKANLGKKYSEETRNKIREARLTTNGARGKVVSEDTKEKIRQANLGKKCSEETKLKIRLANTGHRHSDESKKKMSDAKRRKKNSE